MSLSSRTQSLELRPEVSLDLVITSIPALDNPELGDIGLRPISNQAEPDRDSLQNESPFEHTPQDDADRLISHQVQSWSNPPINRWRVLSCCLVYFGNGMNDSAPGALLPYMEAHYSIGYAVVSLVFVSQAAGFVSAALFTDALKTRLGRARTYALAEALMVAAYAVLAAAPPFPVVALVFFLLGWAMAMNLALSNVFCANLAQSTVVLGAAHGAYGIGGTIGPIIATAMVSKGILWSRYYLITLAICLVGGLASWWSFRDIESEPGSQLMSSLERVSQPSKRSLLVEALKNPVMIIGALFTFAYQGAEVSISRLGHIFPHHRALRRPRKGRLRHGRLLGTPPSTGCPNLTRQGRHHPRPLHPRPPGRPPRRAPLRLRPRPRRRRPPAARLAGPGRVVGDAIAVSLVGYATRGPWPPAPRRSSRARCRAPRPHARRGVRLVGGLVERRRVAVRHGAARAGPRGTWVLHARLHRAVCVHAGVLVDAGGARQARRVGRFALCRLGGTADVVVDSPWRRWRDDKAPIQVRRLTSLRSVFHIITRAALLGLVRPVSRLGSDSEDSCRS